MYVDTNGKSSTEIVKILEKKLICDLYFLGCACGYFCPPPVKNDPIFCYDMTRSIELILRYSYYFNFIDDSTLVRSIFLEGANLHVSCLISQALE